MDAALAGLLAKLARELGEEALKVKPHVHGEWLGKLEYEKHGGLYLVKQSADDPLRLWIPEIGFEYAFKGGFESDGGSIPKILQCAKPLRLKPDSFPMSYFMHDSCYDEGAIWARKPGEKTWVRVPLTREMADCILYIGLTAEDATLVEARVIYRGVRVGGEEAWARCRRAEEKEAKR